MLGQLTNDEIEEVLKSNLLGRIGCSNGKKIYVLPVNYVYDGQYIFAQSREGMKIDIMRNNPAVCFEVDEVQDFTNWRSVVLWGVYQELSDERSRYYAMKAFTERMMQVKNSITAQLLEVSEASIDNENFHYSKTKPVIYRIVIKERSGRFEKE
jgi:nitroimidazol reductase NimA-like FMN-containing flavoprotein (pyridoxamine 5'-phosphate oxidase superfamily)